MAEKLKNMMSAESWIPYTYAEHMLMVDVFAKIPDAEIVEPVAFTGLSDGKRNTEKQASLYDSMLSEIYAERDGEKAKVRNRRKAERKAKRKSGAYVKRNGGDWRKDEHYAGDKGLHYPESLMMPESRVKSREKYVRIDWEIEQDNHADAMAEHYDYIRMAEDHERRLNELEEIEGSVDFWETSADYISREKIYERNRIKQMMDYADAICAGEEYYRKQKSFGINAGVYLRMIRREYKEWLKWA